MLQRIISIRNVGRFLNSAATPNPTIARHSFIFGPNGFGKTTLCAILRSSERGEPNYILGRRSLGVGQAPAVSLLWAGAQRNFQADAWPSAEPKLSIFDGTFVAENVHSGEVVDVGNRRNFYRVVVGRNGVGLAREEARLAERSRALQTALAEAERRLEPMTGGLTPSAFDRLPTDPDLDAKLGTARAALVAQQQAAEIQARPALTPLLLPDLPDDLGHILQRTLEGADPASERVLAAHLLTHRLGEDGERWLATGTRLAGEDDDCPFCARDDLQAQPVMRAYRTLFGEDYAALRDAIDRLRHAADRQFGAASFGELRATAIGNVAARDFWQQHCAFETPLPSVAELRDRYASVLHKLEALIERKAGSPLDVVDRSSDLRDLAEEVSEVRAILAAYNAVVEQMNNLIEGVRERTAAADEATLRRVVGDLERLSRRHGTEGLAACAAWRTAYEAKRANNEAKTQVRAQLDEHCERVVRPYQDRINAFLQLFMAGFQITGVDHAYPGGQATCTYRLRINAVDVALGDGRTGEGEPSFKNTLSAGDRTTLALAFFLAELEREADIHERTVVFDDPFNSQDTYRRRNTIHEIVAVARRGAQIIVLSHDAAFLKSVWEKCPPDERSAAQLDYHPSTGTKLREFDLGNACQGRAQTELDDLLAFRANGAGVPRDIIKKLRVVLETRLRELYPASFAPADMLGGMIGKIRDGGADHPAAAWHDELDRINDYTRDYHHGEDPRGAPEPPLDPQELRGFVEQTLRIANAIVG